MKFKGSEDEKTQLFGNVFYVHLEFQTMNKVHKPNYSEEMKLVYIVYFHCSCNLQNVASQIREVIKLRMLF
jgi:hypothetical protein